MLHRNEKKGKQNVELFVLGRLYLDALICV